MVQLNFSSAASALNCSVLKSDRKFEINSTRINPRVVSSNQRASANKFASNLTLWATKTALLLIQKFPLPLVQTLVLCDSEHLLVGQFDVLINRSREFTSVLGLGN